jgi:hypothetical protein
MRVEMRCRRGSASLLGLSLLLLPASLPAQEPVPTEETTAPGRFGLRAGWGTSSADWE